MKSETRTRYAALVSALVVTCGLIACSSSPEPTGPWWTTHVTETVGEDPLALAFGDSSYAWKVTSGRMTPAHDDGLARDVLTATDANTVTIEGQTKYRGAFELTAHVRLRTNVHAGVTALFHVGDGEGNNSAVSMSLNGNRANDDVTIYAWQNDKPLHDLAALADTMDWRPAYTNSLTYALLAYQQIQPGWEVDYRQRIEADMATLPRREDKWIEVRIQFDDGILRGWVDDRLIAVKSDASIKPAGAIKMALTAGVQLAACTVRPWKSVDGFEPIRLGAYANERAMLDGQAIRSESLPSAGEMVDVDGVPFIFSGINLEGNDHVDVGRSLFRQANLIGYFPAWPGVNARWYGAQRRDPARIQLRIPNDHYSDLYVVAAADGEEGSIPLLSAMFYRPMAGFTQTVEGDVPLASADVIGAKPLPVRLENGRALNLWLVRIPIDPAMLTSFADLDVVEVELTKKTYQYRSYPDPISYGYHQGGRPSGVHVYAMTLARAPYVFTWEPDRFGHVWVSPETPSYTARLTNRGTDGLAGTVTVTTRSHDGAEVTTQSADITAAAGAVGDVNIKLPVKLFGYHDVTAVLRIGEDTWMEKRSLVNLASDTRSARWTEGKGAIFGYWSYHGGHHTPKADHVVRLMTWAGARQSLGLPSVLKSETEALMARHWGTAQAGAWTVSPQAWATEEPFDPEKVKAFQDEIIAKWKKDREATPEAHRPDHVYFYPEPHISARLTAGNSQEYVTGRPVELTEHEQKNLKMFFNTSKLAAEAVRRELPGLKVLIPWGDPGFSWPLLEAGFPKELIDGSGLDIPGFERIPERQLHEQSLHRLYLTRKAYADFGMENPQLQFCEGIFVPTEPGAVTWREQMDIYHRWNLLSMAYGVDRFYSGWFGFDCGNYYGAEHYGGCGIQRRIPYCDPKPAYAAFATMTDKLNEANFDGWVPTGSLSTYCLRFKHDTRGYVYALWTLRGKRPVTLTLKADATTTVTDSMNNAQQVTNGNAVTFMTDASVVYVTGGGEVAAVSLGEPDHGDAGPAPLARQVADLGDGTWRYTDRRDTIYENNHWAISPEAGAFAASIETDAQHGSVLTSTLGSQSTVRQFMPWYSVLSPDRAIPLSAAPARLGLWVKGGSDWGRVIYILRDARGERWTSIGYKDQYNSDDPHSWSSFNFDGWRYLTFELPGHIGYDNFRKHGGTWWRSDDGDDVVDLPLALEEIIIEQRTHVLYVNDVQPAATDTVSFGKLYVEYDTPQDMTQQALKLSRQRMPSAEAPANLQNPIARMQNEGEAPPTRMGELTEPAHYYDGTRMHVHFDEVSGATKYFVWVGPYADGRGAVNIAPAGVTNGQLIGGLRPGVRLYYWVTYTDADGKASLPSQVHEQVTVDNFKEK